MPFTAAIMACVLVYVWLVEPYVPRSAVFIPAAVVVIFTAWHDLRHEDWGFSWPALATGLWLSALNVRYRDVRHAVPFLVQFWLFVTPVAYASSLVPARWHRWYALNPMVGVVDGFRWSILGRPELPIGAAAISAFVMLLILLGGLAYFRSTERTFADVI